MLQLHRPDATRKSTSRALALLASVLLLAGLTFVGEAQASAHPSDRTLANTHVAKKASKKPAQVKTKIKIASAIQAVHGEAKCGNYECTKFTVKLSCKPTACKKGRTVTVSNKDDSGDNIWRVVWKGKTNARGKVTTPWLNKDKWYSDWFVGGPNPIKVSTAKKKTTKKVYSAAKWAGEVSYRHLDLNPS